MADLNGYRSTANNRAAFATADAVETDAATMAPELASGNIFARLLADLESSRLVVGLVPQRRFTNHGGMIRVAFERNALWYRDLCAAHPSTRRRKNLAPDTIIRRAAVVRTLRRLAAGIRCRGFYATQLERVAVLEQARAAVPAAARRAMTQRLFGAA